jgi:hypothetical protein
MIRRSAILAFVAATVLAGPAVVAVPAEPALAAVEDFAVPAGAQPQSAPAPADQLPQTAPIAAAPIAAPPISPPANQPPSSVAPVAEPAAPPPSTTVDQPPPLTASLAAPPVPASPAPVTAPPASRAPPLVQSPPVAPTELAPAPSVAPAPPAPIDQGPPLAKTIPPPAPVLVQPLETLDLFSSGRDTGLGGELWKGSSAAIARTVIPTLADKPMSPAAIGLARRVLATAATAPDGAGSDADLAAARVRALLALGDAPGVDAILERTPGVTNNAALSQIAAEAALITDQPDKACRISEGLSTGREALYWLRLRAYCQARQGRGAEAQLTFTIATQQGADPDYARLMGVILAKAGDPGPAALRDGLDYALSRGLQLDPGPALADAPPAIAEHVRAAPGAAAPDHIIASPPPSEADVLAALRAAKTPAAYLIAAMAQAPGALALAQPHATLVAPVQIATAALAAGDLASAQQIRAGLVQDTIPGASATDLAILDAAIAVAADKPDPQALDRLAERGMSADSEAKVRAQAAAAIYAPFAGAVGPNARAELSGFDLGAGEGASGAMLALDLAADARAKGDVAMLSLRLAQAGGAAGPAPAARARLERALARAGLVADAKAFALEGLIGLQSR